MIQLNKCSKIYTKKEVGINDVNLTFDNKGFVLIQGESGSGKSTLINCMYGLDSFTSGEILLDGKHLKNLQEYSTFMFQEPKFFENMTVIENILFSIEDNNIDVNNILTLLKIDDKKDKLINKLSGGERQRVSLARALVKDTPIIFCDEPTSNLDKKTELEIFDLLKNISKNKLVIIVSHNSSDVMRYADKRIIISDGDVIEVKDISTSNDDKMLPVKKIKFMNKFAFKISLNNIKKNIVKSIMTVLFMFISLVIISFLLNILTINIDKLSYNAYSDDKIDYVKFNRNSPEDKIYTAAPQYNITDATINEINPEIICYDDVNLKTIYDNNTIYFHSVWINQKDDLNEYNLEQNEVYVSSNLFEETITNINEVIGNKLQVSNNLLTIKGFLPSGYDDIIMMNKYTFVLCNGNLLSDSDFNIKLSEETYSSYSAYNQYTSSSVSNIIEGKLPSVSGEICLPKNLVEQLFPNEKSSNLIGKKISIPFFEKMPITMESPSSVETFTLTGYTNSEIVFYDSDYSIYLEKYGSERISAGLLGVIYFNYSLNTFENASEHNLSHQGSLSEKIYAVYDILNSFKKLLLVLLIIFIVIEVFTIINNVSTSILKNKKDLGILISLGIKKISLCKIYIYETFFCAFVSVIFAVIAYIISINILNASFAKEYLFDFKVLNVNILIITLIFIMSLLIILVSVIIPMLNILKKKQIDILYER